VKRRLQVRSLFAGWCCTVLLIGGCALPDYHLPRGFSSTYYRKLQESQQFTPVAVPPAEPIPDRGYGAGKFLGVANNEAVAAPTPR
jgi:hypothetical protein